MFMTRPQIPQAAEKKFENGRWLYYDTEYGEYLDRYGNPHDFQRKPSKFETTPRGVLVRVFSDFVMQKIAALNLMTAKERARHPVTEGEQHNLLVMLRFHRAKLASAPPQQRDPEVLARFTAEIERIRVLNFNDIKAVRAYEKSIADIAHYQGFDLKK